MLACRNETTIVTYSHHGPGPLCGMARPSRKPVGIFVTVMSPGRQHAGLSEVFEREGTQY